MYINCHSEAQLKRPVGRNVDVWLMVSEVSIYYEKEEIRWHKADSKQTEGERVASFFYPIF